MRELKGYLDPENYAHVDNAELGELKEKVEEINAQIVEHISEIEEKVHALKDIEQVDVAENKFELTKRTI